MALATTGERPGLLELGIRMSDNMSKFWGAICMRFGGEDVDAYENLSIAFAVEHFVLNVRAFALLHRHDVKDQLLKHLGPTKPDGWNPTPWVNMLEMLLGTTFKAFSGTQGVAVVTTGLAVVARPLKHGTKMARWDDGEPIGVWMHRCGILLSYCIPHAMLKLASSETADPLTTVITHNDCKRLNDCFFKHIALTYKKVGSCPVFWHHVVPQFELAYPLLPMMRDRQKTWATMLHHRFHNGRAKSAAVSHC
jgi:hypothetical protein